MSKSPQARKNTTQKRPRVPHHASLDHRSTRRAPLFLALLLSAPAALADTTDRNPASDEAISGTWDGSAETRYTIVDDHPDASGSDYLTHGTTAGNITFGFSAFSIPSTHTITTVTVSYYDQRTGGASSTAAARLKVGGSYYNASTHNPANGTWNLRTDAWTENPATSAAWTVDDVNATGANPLQAFGFASTDANPTVRFSSVILTVTHNDPNAKAIRRVYISQAQP